MRIILLNPTGKETTQLVCGKQIWNFPHAKRDSGKALLTALKKLNIQPEDELQVIRGEGNFTAIRSCALLANAIHYLTGCKLTSRKASEKHFRSVKQIQPFYGKPPSITIAQKHL